MMCLGVSCTFGAQIVHLTSDYVNAFLSFILLYPQPIKMPEPRSQLPFQFPADILENHTEFFQLYPKDSLAQEIHQNFSLDPIWRKAAEDNYVLTSNDWMQVSAPLFAAKYFTISRNSPAIPWGARDQYFIPNPARYLVCIFFTVRFPPILPLVLPSWVK